MIRFGNLEMANIMTRVKAAFPMRFFPKILFERSLTSAEKKRVGAVRDLKPKTDPRGGAGDGGKSDKTLPRTEEVHFEWGWPRPGQHHCKSACDVALLSIQFGETKS